VTVAELKLAPAIEALADDQGRPSAAIEALAEDRTNRERDLQGLARIVADFKATQERRMLSTSLLPER
jgi:hypothetical protein